MHFASVSDKKTQEQSYYHTKLMSYLTENTDQPESIGFTDQTLRQFFADNYVTGVTKNEISAYTGISARNLNRYLGYEEFSGIYITEDATGINNEISEGKISL